MSFKDILSRSRQDAEADFLKDPEDDQVVGRTGADLLYGSRFYLLAVIAIVLFMAGYILIPGLSEAISDNSEILKLFFIPMVIFYYVGMKVIPVFLQVPTTDFVVFDFVNFTGAIYRIPKPLLTQMDINGGNSLQFSWRTGDTFRFARSVDIENGVIELAWPHEVPIEQAAFTLSDLQRRESDYELKSIENLLLRRRPVVIAADLARGSNQYLSKELSDLLKLKDFDIAEYLKGLDPLKDADKAADIEDNGGDRDGERAP